MLVTVHVHCVLYALILSHNDQQKDNRSYAEQCAIATTTLKNKITLIIKITLLLKHQNTTSVLLDTTISKQSKQSIHRHQTLHRYRNARPLWPNVTSSINQKYTT